MISIAIYKHDIPQNTASILRLCSCLGLKIHIIEPCGFNLNDSRFKRVVMDYINQSSIIRHENLKDKLKIPISSNTRSLNVAISASIAAAEALRQIKKF